MTGITVLAEASREFDLLVALPVLMGGRVFGEDRDYRMDEVKGLLLARATSPATRDLIWCEIVKSTRSRGDIWKTVALGMALPGLANLAKQFARDYADTSYEDLCAEVVTAFLEALRTVDVDRPAILTRMYWSTYRAVRRSAYAEVLVAKAVAAATMNAHAESESESGHPDLVLVRLVSENVITAAEAGLISAVRLDRRPLGDVAELLEISPNAVLLRLRKAEMRVAAHLTGTTGSSRRAFKRGRKSEAGSTSDSSESSSRTSFVEEPPGDLAA
ncbi:sigma-70 family RNA polymerase sigma factor [Catenulispora pinisilvae]|uniref:sigma-70 family RNA polymerase sigma factor n=1 Tax=Catenulispora pinisilvae TaxID=2705253 RepID=UPI0018928530|nr:sigma-70 family RNA polymerase sigma factor [Catenulispora pinisilvae]